MQLLNPNQFVSDILLTIFLGLVGFVTVVAVGKQVFDVVAHLLKSEKK